MRINLIGSCCFIADRKTENVCGTPANAKKFLETLAGLPQTPKSFSRHLRDSRKHQKVSRDTCGTPANAKKFLVTLAGLPQTPKNFSRHFRDSRKHQKISRGICNTVANDKSFFGALATPLQTPKSFSEDLQHRCKRFQKPYSHKTKQGRTPHTWGPSLSDYMYRRKGENAPLLSSYLFSSAKRISKIWQAALATDVPGP